MVDKHDSEMPWGLDFGQTDRWTFVIVELLLHLKIMTMSSL